MLVFIQAPRNHFACIAVQGFDSCTFLFHTIYVETHRRNPMSYKRGTMLYLAAMYLQFCFPFDEVLAGEELVLRESIQLGVPTAACIKPEDVIEMIELAEVSNLQEAVQQTEGCNWISQPLTVRMVAIATFETNKFKYLLVRLELLDVEAPPLYTIGAAHNVTKS